MRLVCPNCGAQYEVDERVIPETGRDVQCSACGHAWYQMPSHHAEVDDEIPLSETELTAEEALAAEGLPEEFLPDEVLPGDDENPATVESVIEEEIDLDAIAAAAMETPEEAEDGSEDIAENETPDEDEAEEPVEPAAEHLPGRRPIDESVRDILQEEARHEIALRSETRSHEPEPVETQPELGIDDLPSETETRRRLARERMARLRGTEPGEEEAETDFDEEANLEDDAPDDSAPDVKPEPLHGRDLFPDIEEINSTLDSREAPGAEAAEGASKARSSGFARGFTLVLLLAVIAVALYVMAPMLVEKVPALRPALAGYVDTVNTARHWLDQTMQGMTANIEARVQDGQ